MNQSIGQADSHRQFLNRYYGISRHFYDLSRKYYLFGRDTELRALLDEDWDSLVEIGPGTGRNLRHLHSKRPGARYGGIEASDEMLKHAQERCPFAQFNHGFAENAAIHGVIGRRPERILFSYCLSMVQEPQRAIENAVSSLAPGGEVVVVDFADFSGLPKIAARGLTNWLNTFHVNPVPPEDLTGWGGATSFGPFGYFVRARFSA